MNTSFVTSFFNIYDKPLYNERTIEWRIEKFKILAKSGIKICIVICPEYNEIINELCNIYDNIKIIRICSLNHTKMGLKYLNETRCADVELPTIRHTEKDTIEYLCLMNSKIEFIENAININPFHSDYFAWIDFNIYHIFRDENTIELLKFIGKANFFNKSFLAIPGCWSTPTYDLNNINWRFCGGFLFGDKKTLNLWINQLWNTIELYFANFISWEVNIWAFNEYIHPKNENIIWYKADHNDTIIHIPTHLFSLCLNSFLNNDHDYNLNIINGFNPSSISYIYYKNKHILNIRYVNYFILENGCYSYLSNIEKIENKNLSCILDNDMNIGNGNLSLMNEELGLMQKYSFSQGLEDIRLWIENDNIKFIANTIGYSSTNLNKIIIGDYNISTYELNNGKIIEFNPLCCEKNWIPLPNGTHFIYSWFPYRIGIIENNNLKITHEYYPIVPHFHTKFRGSTIFHKINMSLKGYFQNYYIGIVHFSENETPRRYFHVFVIIDNYTNLPIHFSQPFYFYNNNLIEFCIGFTILSDNFLLWASKYDREPKLFQIPCDTILNLFSV